MQDKRLFLLDAYALIFRAYYALIRMPRITRTGFNTSAIFGFVNTLEELLRKEDPTHIAVCFDPPGPTFRNEAYDRYKAERSATPEDIRLSIPFIKEIVRAYRIPLVEVPGFEADDVIGSLARQAEKENFTVYMMTPDKDFGQLVSPNIYQYKPSYRGQDFELRGEAEVCARYGLQNTSQVIDLLALMGDKVDNIPGCPGVGEKTAVKLINDFGSVENLLDNTSQLKGALKKRVEENAEEIRFSKFLATIRTDAPVEITPAELKRKTPDRDKLFAIFDELEFKTLAERVRRRLDSDGRPASGETNTKKDTEACNAYENKEAKSAEVKDSFEKAEYIIADTPETRRRFDEEIATAREIGVTLVADGENDVAAVWKGTAVAVRPGLAFYLPRTSAPALSLFDEPSSRDDLLTAKVLDILADKDILKVSFNTKRDMVIAAMASPEKERMDNPYIQNFYDLGLAHYVLQPELRHNPGSLAAQYLGYDPMPTPATGGRSASKEAKDPNEEARIACLEADIALRIRSTLEEEVKREGMDNLLYDLEFPLVEVLAAMEITGVRIDVNALHAAAEDMKARIHALEQEIFALAGEEFNVGSPAKVGEILFDRLGLDPKAKKTKTGQYSTSEDILEKLTARHPIVEKIIKHRALRKLFSTYLTALPAAINPRTGKVHTNYNQTVTATGRISSSSPNLQNIPVRDDEGREIRRAFIADPGCLFFSADYSQIELRLMADFSGDPIMLDAFRHGEDIHAITAARIFHKDVEDVESNERRKAKTANFGIIYGISPFGLSTRLGIPRAEAKEIIDNYFETFPAVKQYMHDSVEHAREKQYVMTKMGRKRMLPDINSKNPTVRGYAERNAVNAPLQGTAADIIKRAMIDIYREMRQKGMRSKMIMQVHDELNFNVMEDELPALQEMVERLMQQAYDGRVTLTASGGVASNWLEAH